MSNGNAITVAVRIRPMSKGELDAGESVVKVDGNTLTLKPMKDRAGKSWEFDHVWDSSNLHHPSFASQEKVFFDVGRKVVDASFDGYNASIFAYGQTGSGKTYCMMGAGDSEEAGVIPRLCTELFERTKDAGRCEVEMSFLEIYQEELEDLLSPAGTKKRKAPIHKSGKLKVHEDPKKGFFVTNLTSVKVEKVGDVLEGLRKGNMARHVGETKMNVTSSRSHAVFWLKLKHADESLAQSTSSKIVLVDLAGSERQKKTGSEGVRRAEATSINMSLFTLGKVITILADNSSPGRKKQRVPYRDSLLTRLLTDTLGGNSKTYMISTISPSASQYDETMSTLMYAGQAKSIVQEAKVNKTQDQVIVNLRAEMETLKRSIHPAAPFGHDEAADAKTAKIIEELEAKVAMHEETIANYKEAASAHELLKRQMDKQKASWRLREKELEERIKGGACLAKEIVKLREQEVSCQQDSSDSATLQQQLLEKQTSWYRELEGVGLDEQNDGSGTLAADLSELQKQLHEKEAMWRQELAKSTDAEVAQKRLDTELAQLEKQFCDKELALLQQLEEANTRARLAERQARADERSFLTEELAELQEQLTDKWNQLLEDLKEEQDADARARLVAGYGEQAGILRLKQDSWHQTLGEAMERAESNPYADVLGELQQQLQQMEASMQQREQELEKRMKQSNVADWTRLAFDHASQAVLRAKLQEDLHDKWHQMLDAADSQRRANTEQKERARIRDSSTAALASLRTNLRGEEAAWHRRRLQLQRELDAASDASVSDRLSAERAERIAKLSRLRQELGSADATWRRGLDEQVQTALRDRLIAEQSASEAELSLLRRRIAASKQLKRVEESKTKLAFEARIREMRRTEQLWEKERSNLNDTIKTLQRSLSHAKNNNNNYPNSKPVFVLTQEKEQC
eukprot:gene9195-14258_t